MSEQPTFFEIRNRILEWPGLSLAAKTIWTSLCQYSWTDGSCYHSRQTLAKNHGMTMEMVKRARAELVRKKLISVFKRPLPATAVTFPFIQFQTIEQRDKNVVRLGNQIGSKSTLSSVNDNNDLQGDRCLCDPIIGSKSTLLIGSKSTPIKENSLKENLKLEDNTTNVVFCQTCHQDDKFDTSSTPADASVETQPKLTRKQKSERHRATREEQLDKIKANLGEYKAQYPEIDINLEIENFEYWLANFPKGKMRKDIFATWGNWLHREHVQQQKRKKQPTNKTKSKREFNEEEYKRYVAEYTNC